MSRDPNNRQTAFEVVCVTPTRLRLSPTVKRDHGPT